MFGDTEKQLLEKILLAVLSGPTAGNYANGTPTFTPVTTTAFAVDTSNGHLWIYYSGAWHLHP